jgi:hypothetical protein
MNNIVLLIVTLFTPRLRTFSFRPGGRFDIEQDFERSSSERLKHLKHLLCFILAKFDLKKRTDVQDREVFNSFFSNFDAVLPNFFKFSKPMQNFVILRRKITHKNLIKILGRPITVKPVYSNQARSWASLVVMDRWFLYTVKPALATTCL